MGRDDLRPEDKDRKVSFLERFLDSTRCRDVPGSGLGCRISGCLGNCCGSFSVTRGDLFFFWSQASNESEGLQHRAHALGGILAEEAAKVRRSLLTTWR